MKKIFIISILVLITSLTSFIFAQTNDQSIIPLVKCKGEDCTWNDFVITLQKLIRAMLIFGYWLAAIVCLVGAFMVMLGGYNKGWLNTGKKIMIDALVYYVILLLAGVIFDLILEFLRPVLFVGQ